MGNPLMGLQIGGQAQQDIARYIGSIAKNRAMQRGIGEARGYLEQGRNEAVGAYGTARGYQLPWLKAGESALDRMSQGAQAGEFVGPEREKIDYGKFDFQSDPGYQFRMQEGMRAAQGSAAARGLGLSGATMRAMQRYGQNLASQEYGNAYNRFAQERQFAYGQDADLYSSEVGRRAALWNQFTGLSGLGQTAANNLSNMATAQGQRMGEYYDQMGNLSLASATQLRNAYQDAQDAAVLQGQGAKDFGGMGGSMFGGGGSNANVGQQVTAPTVGQRQIGSAPVQYQQYRPIRSQPIQIYDDRMVG